MTLSSLSLCRIAVISHDLRIADIPYNVERHIHAMREAISNGAQMIVFPELSTTGYTCADLFFQEELISSAMKGVCSIAEQVPAGVIVIVGVPIHHEGKLYNCAAVLEGGTIHALVPKTIIPNHHEFYEARWFVSGDELQEDSLIILNDASGNSIECLLQSHLLFRTGKVVFGIELCEDLWSMIPPSSLMAEQGAFIILNLSASNALVGKEAYRTSLVAMQSASTISAYAYASAGPSESTMDTVFSGHIMIAENGVIIAEDASLSFETKIKYADIDIDVLLHERRTLSRTQASHAMAFTVFELPLLRDVEVDVLHRVIDPMPFIPTKDANDRFHEILQIQAMGLAGRLRKTGITSMIVGLSGGLDSTLALIVCLEACSILNIDKSNVIAITMPGPGTSDKTLENARLLANTAKTTFREIPIYDAVYQHLRDIGHAEQDHSIVFENAQARERTHILMDCANQHGGLVIGTGDMSELALGWCTYNGDHMSMYGVNSGVPKTLVKHLVEYYADSHEDEHMSKVLRAILETPVSPELLPLSDKGEIVQKTEDIIGPYVLHDFFLYQMMRHGFGPRKIIALAYQAWKHEYSKKEIAGYLRLFYQRFFSQQFKRSSMPDGVKVGSIALSPRADWRMPSDAQARIWIDEIDAFLSSL